MWPSSAQIGMDDLSPYHVALFISPDEKVHFVDTETIDTPLPYITQ